MVFAIYQYYSCGNKLLDVPTEIIRDNPDLDLPFYLFWANESWRKMWFGQDKKIVWEQKYGNEDDCRRHFQYCLPYFKMKDIFVSMICQFMRFIMHGTFQMSNDLLRFGMKKRIKQG